MPLRGSNDAGRLSIEEPNENDGNFRALLRYRAKGDEIFKNSLEKAPKNASYISLFIQNELINIIGKEIQKNIVKEVNEAGFFSILADETTDISGKEQLTLCVRFFDRSSIQIKEYFLKFVDINGTTGKEISQTLLETVKNLGLDLNMLRGQGYDGAANMSGRHNGVQAIIRQLYPSAIYVHCASHTLNLCLNTASKILEIRNTFATISEICNYFRGSSKRTHILSNIFKESGQSDKRLQLYCETRWVERHDCVQIFYNSIPQLIEALENMDDKGKFLKKYFF